MYPHSYTFNQTRLFNKLNSTGATSVLFTLAKVEIPHSEPKRRFQHIIAQFMGGSTTEAEEFGCPYPPGWQDDGYVVPSGNLAICPQFSITRAELLDSIRKNQFKFNDEVQLRVDVVGTIEVVHHKPPSDPEVDFPTLVANLNIISLSETGSTINKTLLTKTVPPAP